MQLQGGPSGPEGRPPGTRLTPSEVASQLGHPLAALQEGVHGQPQLECGYTRLDARSRLDSALLTYDRPTVCVETAVRASRSAQQLDDAARGALTGFRLNAELAEAIPPDMDAWMKAVLAEGATLSTRSDSPATTIDGAPFALVVVEDGTYQAWALETDQMRITVAGRREHLESVQLRWWHPALTP